MEFLELVEDRLKVLHIDSELMRRPVNEGFSGGEKKRNEIFQMLVLQPTLGDPRRDRLGPRHRRAEDRRRGRQRDAAAPTRAIVVVTHYQRLLELHRARLRARAERRPASCKSGGKELALELEEKGYGWLEARAGHRGSRCVSRRTPGAGRVERYLAQFEAAVGPASGGPAWLESRRRDGDRRGSRRSASRRPGTRSTGSRTSGRSRTPTSGIRAAGSDVDRAEFAEHLYGDAVAAELVFVNGRFAAALSVGRSPADGRDGGQPDGGPQADAGRSARPLGALAGEDGLGVDGAEHSRCSTMARSVHVGRGVVVDSPINLVFVTTGDGAPTVSYPRVLLVAGEHSQSRFIETHVGLGGGTHFSCAVTEVVAGADSRARSRSRADRAAGRRSTTAGCRCRRRAARRSVSHAFSLGGAIVAQRSRRRARRRGRRLHAERPVPGRRHTLVDNHTTIDHAAAALRQPRGLQGHPRRQGARRLQRQDHRPPGRAEDRREADEQGAAAVGPRADQHQAAARDLRRRREVHARGDRGSARRATRCSTCRRAASRAATRVRCSSAGSRATS